MDINEVLNRLGKEPEYVGKIFTAREEYSRNEFFSRPTVIFGASDAMGKKAIDFLAKYDRTALAFIDNNKSKNGNTFQDSTITIYTPESFLENFKNINVNFIIASLMDSSICAIRRKIEEMGFTDSFIIDKFRISFSNSLQLYDYEHEGIAGSLFNQPWSYYSYFNKSGNKEFLLRDENKKAIEKVYNMLADTKSKEVFEKYILAVANTNMSLEETINLFTGLREEKRQYFDMDIIKLDNNEVFVDAGVFDGRDSFEFARLTNNEYDKIIMFEPNPICSKYIDYTIKKLNLDRCILVKKGLGHKEENVKFAIAETGTGRIDTNGEVEAQFTDLDSALKNMGIEDVTFIKMDIEGCELDALNGAKEIIKKCKPKLAICIYHKIEDLFEIPLYISSICPDYKFYIRKYGCYAYDSLNNGRMSIFDADVYELVLYAVI